MSSSQIVIQKTKNHSQSHVNFRKY